MEQALKSVPLTHYFVHSIISTSFLEKAFCRHCTIINQTNQILPYLSVKFLKNVIFETLEAFFT